MARAATIALLLTLSSSMAAVDIPFPTAIFPLMIPSVLPLGTPSEPITFRDGPDYYQQLDIQRRAQYQATESDKHVEVEKAKSYQLETQHSSGSLAGHDAKDVHTRNPVLNSGLGEKTRSAQTQPQPSRFGSAYQNNQIKRPGQNGQSAFQIPPSDNQRLQSQFVNSYQTSQSLGQHDQSLAENNQAKLPIVPYVSPSLNVPILYPNDAVEPGADLGMHKPLRVTEGSSGLSRGDADAIPVPRANPVSTSITGFGLEIMKALERNPGNAVASPYSIALILALLQQGTEGDPQIQISKALHMTPQQSKETFQRLTTDHQKRQSRNILRIGTSIFFSDTFDVNRQYKTDAGHFFNSELTTTNFANPSSAANEINRWVSGRSQGNIPYLISPDNLSIDTQIVLANVVYFKGLWNETFNKERTLSRPFYMADGTIKPTSFMHHSGSFRAGRDHKLNADFLVMPFEGLQYSLIAIVPSESSGVSSLLQLLSHEDLLSYLNSPQREVIISMPKFKIRVDTDLKAPLYALGIRDIFTENSGLAALGNLRGARPRITSALHTAMLAIDEQGGSAAAATVLAVSTLSIDFNDLEFRFNADRPFVAILWDNEQSVPLFMAKIADPTQP